jgi:hypothetical protein
LSNQVEHFDAFSVMAHLAASVAVVAGVNTAWAILVPLAD